MGSDISNRDLFQRVKELKLPIGKYALFGSAPLGIRRLRDCHDIDIIVTEELWNECKGKNWEIKVGPDGTQYLWSDGIELWKDWKPGNWNIEQLIKEAEIIDGLPFVRLERVLEWKELSGREKDLKDIEIIKAVPADLRVDSKGVWGMDLWKKLNFLEKRKKTEKRRRAK